MAATLRVTAQLVEAETGAILWLQKFDRPLSELAELQEQLVTEVAANLGVQVERIEMEKALRKPGDLTAWEAMIRSLSVHGRLNPDSLRAAIADARRAIAVAPDYAPGHAVLAQALGSLLMHLGTEDPAIALEARTHALRALALDGSDPLVLSQVAICLGFVGSWQEGLVHAQRAVALNPNMALCRTTLALAYLHFDRPDEALAHVDAALILAPRGFQTYMCLGYQGLAHIQAGRYEQALQALELALQLYPYMFSLKDKAICCEKLGRHEDARDAIRRLRTAEPFLTLQAVERSNVIVFSQRTATDLNMTFRKVWTETQG